VDPDDQIDIVGPRPISPPDPRIIRRVVTIVAVLGAVFLAIKLFLPMLWLFILYQLANR